MRCLLQVMCIASRRMANFYRSSHLEAQECVRWHDGRCSTTETSSTPSNDCKYLCSQRVLLTEPSACSQFWRDWGLMYFWIGLTSPTSYLMVLLLSSGPSGKGKPKKFQ